jgi:uncharacterized protein (DUF1800 family)
MKSNKLQALLLSLSIALAMASTNSFAQTVRQDSDNDGMPDSVEAQEGTDPTLKDNAIFTNARFFVMQQYLDFQDRFGDAGGVGYWTQQIESGARSRGQYILDSINSQEFQGNAAPVVRLYLAYFDRIPDLAGLFFWLGEARGGRSLENISSAFAASQEFRNTYGSLSNRAFVDQVYRAVLGRNPDAPGGAFWTDQLDRGLISRGAMMLQFSESAEYKSFKTNAVNVIMVYAGMLRRAPDKPGFDFYVAEANRGVPLLNVINGFLNSSEYQQRFIVPIALPDAARLNAQATFGATREEIVRTNSIGLEGWLAEQFKAPQSSHLALIRSDMATTDNVDRNKDGKIDAEDGRPGWDLMRSTIWKQFFEGNDQLRQRVGYALSQIIVISQQNNIVLDNPESSASYLDILNKHAFGNFRELLKEVTLNPGMGVYLDMKGSQKEDPAKSIQPNENYPRELLQLFSVGTNLLNLDGTEQRGSDGKPIATYDEDTVKGFSKAFTGWTLARQNTAQTWRWEFPDGSGGRWGEPMQQWRSTANVPIYHDMTAKKLLQYNGAPFANLPANQTPEKDLEDAITNVFNHPNVGPFIGKQLIQRLVKSNPSPAYVARVATAFNNNGAGQRGDMKAVVKAILSDVEARTYNPADTRSGKVREPAVTFVAFHRAFGGRCNTGRYQFWIGNDDLGQRPLSAPSVFNFYSPDHSPSGMLAQANVLAPEFEIVNSTQILNFANFSQWGMILDGTKQQAGDYAGAGHSIRETDPLYQYRNCTNTLTYGNYLTLADNPPALVDELNLLFLNQQMSADLRARLVDTVTKLTETNTALSAAERTARQRVDRVRQAVWLILNSPEYAVLK